MLYSIVKSIHILAVIIWIGVMLSVTLNSTRILDLEYVKRARLVMGLAMVATWAAGIFLAVRMGWFASGWLKIKVVIVVVLSGYHGVLAGKLRKGLGAENAMLEKWGSGIVVFATFAVVFLAASKVI